MEKILGIDYPTLWFLVVGGLFSGYTILDGFDFGAGAWHLFFKKEESRRIALNAVGPVWDGNEVWLVIGSGALFAGFPVMYASMFSAMYIPIILFLMFIIFRAISIEFRSKEPMLWWRKMWDISYSISSVMLAFLLGVVVGNILQGIALDSGFDYTGSWLDFLNPYALATGVLTLSVFMMHGAIYLLMKTEGKLYKKLIGLFKKAMIFFIVIFSLITLYTLLYIPHLSDNLKKNAMLFIVPASVFLSIANVVRLVSKRKFHLAFLFSSLTLSLLMAIVAIELYPTLLISSTDPIHNSITIYNASASDKSLGIMLIFVAVGCPLVLSYTAFVYKTFKGKVTIDEHSY